MKLRIGYLILGLVLGVNLTLTFIPRTVYYKTIIDVAIISCRLGCDLSRANSLTCYEQCAIYVKGFEKELFNGK